MKTLRMTFLLILPIATLASEVKRGDRIEGVRLALGEEKGHVQKGEHELFYFDRGAVELTAGMVTRADVRSEEQQVDFEAAAIATRKAQTLNRTQLIAEGEALKARMLSDASFQSAPLSYQVSFWLNFSTKYTAVPCSVELNLARAKLNEQAEAARIQKEETQRIAEQQAARDWIARDPFFISYNNQLYNNCRVRPYERRREYHDRITYDSNSIRPDVPCRADGDRVSQSTAQEPFRKGTFNASTTQPAWITEGRTQVPGGTAVGFIDSMASPARRL